MEKFTIQTNLFKDENELNIFVQNVRDMRHAQLRIETALEELEYLDENEKEESLLKVNSEATKAQLFEKQVDTVLESLPEVGAIFL